AYDDPGDGYGDHRLDRFRLAGGTLRCEREGAYPPPGELRVVVHGPGAATAVGRGGFDELPLR
ncbi:MAG: hypothetical protein ACRDZR_06500, partial [Acidimicrobiales bacterium]